MATKRLPSLPPVQFVLEYTEVNARQEMEDGHMTDKVDVIPVALRLETPTIKPVLRVREVQQAKGDMTNEVAHRANGGIKQGNRELWLTMDTSQETLVRLELTKAQQIAFTNYTETMFQIHRRVAEPDRAKYPDAPIGKSGEKVSPR